LPLDTSIAKNLKKQGTGSFIFRSTGFKGESLFAGPANEPEGTRRGGVTEEKDPEEPVGRESGVREGGLRSGKRVLGKKSQLRNRTFGN